MLKDLNRFISSTRLVIRNLPPNLDEPKLKKLIYKFATVKLKMTELKIMKDLKTGKSKGFAFATFAEDEMAISTLRYYELFYFVWAIYEYTDTRCPNLVYNLLDE